MNGRRCEIAVVGLSTYYSYPNVNEKNNVVWVIHDFDRQKIELPKGPAKAGGSGVIQGPWSQD